MSVISCGERGTRTPTPLRASALGGCNEVLYKGSPFSTFQPFLAFHCFRSCFIFLYMNNTPRTESTGRINQTFVVPLDSFIQIISLSNIGSVEFFRNKNINRICPSHLAESEGLEPPHPCGRRFSRPLQYHYASSPV